MADNEQDSAMQAHKATITLKKNVAGPASAGDPASSAPASTSHVTQIPGGAKQTIRLRAHSLFGSSSVSSPASAAASQVPVNPAAPVAPAAGSALQNMAKRTIRLMPKQDAAASTPAQAPQSAVKINNPAPAPAPAPAVSPSTSTVSLSNHNVPSPSSQPTIKLNANSAKPSSPTIKLGSASAASQSAHPTIKLKPTGGSIPVSAPRTVSPSQPTIKLSTPGSALSAGGSPAATPSSQPTIKLTKPGQTSSSAPVSSQPTLKLKTPGQASDSGAAPQPAGEVNTVKIEKTGLSIRKNDPATSNVPPSARQNAPMIPTGPKVDEPSPIFLLTSIVALLLFGFTAYVLCAQYLNHYESKNLPVPGLEQKVGK